MAGSRASPSGAASAAALAPGVRRREVFGWAMYDFANSGFTTVVLTAVFNAYFVGVVAGNADWATLAWTLTLAASSLLVMLTMPAVGAWADARAAKKQVLLLATVGCVVGTVALGWTGPGTLALAIAATIAANYFYSVGESIAAAFLPELSRPEALGRVSGWGWSLGYLGGMLALGLCLGWVLAAQARGERASEFVPVTMWIVAAVYAIAALPTFALLRERAVPQPQARGGVGEAFGRLARTWREARAFSDFVRMLACGVFYQAGIWVVVSLAAIYAEQVMGFGQAQTMALLFTVNIAAALGALAFGYAQDRMGHRRALGATLVGWIAMVAVAAFTSSVSAFWVAATLAGLCMGSSQSAGRAMIGLLAPAARRAEFYGLWAFAIRLSAIVGPVTYGMVTWLTGGDHRLAILATGGFFVVGLVILAGVDLDRGRRAAAEG